MSVDTSDSTPPAEGEEGGCPCSLLDPGRAHVCVTAGISSPEALASGEACAPSFSSSVRPRDPAVGGSTAEAIAEAAVEAVYGAALVLEALDRGVGWRERGQPVGRVKGRSRKEPRVQGLL